MEIFNETGLALGWVVGRVLSSGYALTAIVKGTFALVAGGTAALVPEDDRLSLDGDRFHDDDPAASLRYDSDFAPFKPRADVLLVGSCYPPGGAAQTASYATLEVGALRKQVFVIGDRYWIGDRMAARPSEPEPFTSMPLRYERSYGGEGFARNPVGRGRAPVRTRAGDERIPLPNLELPGRLITSPTQSPMPAGFGPIDRRWAERASRAGTYGDRWLAERWPGLPDDLDWGYFNAAPEDQQVDVLRGDEAVVLENLHPEHPRLETRLPGLRVRCFVRGAAGDPDDAAREIPLRLDTLWIDADAARLVLVWRGVTPVASRDHEELRRILVATEPLAAPPLPAAHYADERLWQPSEAPDAAEEPQVVGAEEQGAEEPPRAGTEAEVAGAEEQGAEEASPAGMDAEVTAALDEMRAMLEKARVPGEVLDRLRAAASPDDFIAALLAELDRDPEAAARVEQETRERTRQLLIDHGYDPGVLDDDDALPPREAPEAAPRPTRDQVKERAERRETLAGASLAGLDLSGLDLRGADLTGADLTGANLAEARLDGADLSRARLDRASLRGASLARAIAPEASLVEADLSGADLSLASFSGAGLSGATLVEARLDEADLTSATLAKANLERASLRGTVLEGASLAGATLRGAQAPLAHLRGAALGGADGRGACFDDADLSDADLERAQLGGASLRRASLYGARGAEVCMAEADLTELAAGDGASFPRGDFRGARADASSWSDATLRQADFRGASLVRADLDGADLEGALLHRAVLKHASLGKAKLRGAVLTAVNLFQGSLEQADLTGADCRDANLYGVELFDADLTEAKLDGANLKATKLAGRSRW